MTSSSEHLSTPNDPYASGSEKPIVPPKAFVRKRLHSITGLFLIAFLLEHLLTNSQAALWIGDDGVGFVEAVNWIHSLPYLQVIEFGLLFVPFAIHGVWGIASIWEAKYNSRGSDGSVPNFPTYTRNRAFTWQRITAGILLLGVVAHVIDMRFIRYPQESGRGLSKLYAVTTEPDTGLIAVAERLQVLVVTPENKQEIIHRMSHRMNGLDTSPPYSIFNTLPEVQTIEERKEEANLGFIERLNPTPYTWFIVSDSFGKAVLFSVRDVFRSPMMCVLYTIFVLATVYHAGNGLWTAMITWGVSVNESSRCFFRALSYLLILTLMIFGLSSIWLTYFVTLSK